MSDSNLISWAVPRLAQLLPLDEESLTQIVTYSANLSKEEGAEHLKNLLGDSPAAFEFIASFSARREPQRSQPAAPARGGGDNQPATADTPAPRGGARKGKKPKAPLHSAGPVRRPENFGNVTGGYRKEDRDADYMAAAPARMSTRGDTVTGSLQVPRQQGAPSSRDSSAAPSRTQSPVPRTTTPKNPPSASGQLISDLLPNVKAKAAKPSSSSRQQGGGSGKGSLTTSNISDLTAAIAALEVSTNPTLGGGGGGGRKCTCYASIHPLFEPVPNCLHCGKIICSLEGLQPCSFCGTPLLSTDEVQSMIRELRAERGQEKMRAHNEGVQRESGPGPTPVGASKLDAAKAHRDKLLQFQAQNAKRTRVVDEAADFETPNVASTLWMSPAQRALALKKQQRILREMEEKARPEWEKKTTIMSLDIKGGRVTRVYQSAAPAESSSAADTKDEDADDVPRDETKRSGREAFSHNPLLAAGGLLRPVWKTEENTPAEGTTTTTTPKERKQTWRRVQDDNDDNEQWILDGGLHGYTS
ncbi:C2HC5 finger protein [Aspergillus clavatus NRRL 1]|uniref:C2HC5 finger protein n=1 Tax=Aspergillus clavatus (strain ATCC 1007 / CBS 513.65 / DSM 816 / NCTC 3887 / NRRL 1 / QM 1276 / 107) TaxID=344612 RepID=A1CMU7_ASPCL|nr:C2HC5 finger protein [Aspergillus clavatus NRRL 1]EAW08884.1 C2HC5 finger protein [Aspergillus clavatus NRRL 1]